MSSFKWQDFPIFDFSFNNFVTTRLVKLLYAIALIVITLGFLAMVAFGLYGIIRGDFASGFSLLCTSPFVLFIYVLLARVWSEFLIVMFRISENISELVEQGRTKS